MSYDINEDLLQPGQDPEALAGEGAIPPTYSVGNVKDKTGVEPIVAIPRAKAIFYPVEGPFAVKTRDDILQTGEEWTGYLMVTPDDNIQPVHAKAFARIFETFDAEVSDEQSLITELQAELAKANADLEDAEATVSALRAELAAADVDLRTQQEQTGTVPPDDADKSEAIAMENADRYDENAEREAAEHALAERGELDDQEEELLQPDEDEADD